MGIITPRLLVSEDEIYLSMSPDTVTPFRQSICCGFCKHVHKVFFKCFKNSGFMTDIFYCNKCKRKRLQVVLPNINKII